MLDIRRLEGPLLRSQVAFVFLLGRHEAVLAFGCRLLQERHEFRSQSTLNVGRVNAILGFDLFVSERSHRHAHRRHLDIWVVVFYQ